MMHTVTCAQVTLHKRLPHIGSTIRAVIDTVTCFMKRKGASKDVLLLGIALENYLRLCLRCTGNLFNDHLQK